MPDLIAPDHTTLGYLEALEARLATIQLQAGGTNAWAAIRRLREEVRREIDAGWAELEDAAEEMMAADLSSDR